MGWVPRRRRRIACPDPPARNPSGPLLQPEPELETETGPEPEPEPGEVTFSGRVESSPSPSPSPSPNGAKETEPQGVAEDLGQLK